MLRFFTNWLLPAIYTSRTVGRDLHILYFLYFIVGHIFWDDLSSLLKSGHALVISIISLNSNIIYKLGPTTIAKLFFHALGEQVICFVEDISFSGSYSQQTSLGGTWKRTPGRQDAPLDGCSEGLEKAHAGLQGRGQMGAEMKILRWRGHPLRSFLMLDLLKMMVLFSQWESLHLGNL